MAAGENPAAEMIKSVSLIIAGLLLLLPGFSPTSRSSAFIAAGAKASDSEVDAAFALFSHAGGFSARTGGGNTFDGEYQRKDDDHDRLAHKDDRRGLMSKRRIMVMPFSGVFVWQKQP